MEPPDASPEPLRSLRDSATLRAFVEKLMEGIYISNAAGEVLDANPALLEIAGVATLGELRELGSRGLFARLEDRERELELLAAHGAVREFEIEIRRPDGPTARSGPCSTPVTASGIPARARLCSTASWSTSRRARTWSGGCASSRVATR